MRKQKPTESMTLAAIREIMAKYAPSPCVIEPHQKPGSDEEREFMKSSEIWKQQKERLNDE